MNWNNKKIINLVNWGLFASCLVTAYIGYSEYFNDSGITTTFWTRLYFVIQLFVLETNFNPADQLPILLDISRFVAPLVLTSAILSLLIFRLTNYYNTLVIRFFYRHHSVFCGLGTKTYRLALDFIKSGEKVVVIEKDADNPYLNLLRSTKIRILLGSAENPEILLKANIHKATRFFALTDNDKTNINMSHLINDILNKKRIKNPIKIILHLSEISDLQIFKSYQEKKDDKVDIHAFNIFQKAAALIADNYCPDQYIPIQNESDPSAHILIHGMNSIGQALIIEVAQMYHFANLKRTKVTVVDDFISEKAYKFRLQYPLIDQVVEMEFLDSSTITGEIFAFPDCAISVCFICCDSDSQSINMAKYYRQGFVNQKINKNNLFSSHDISVSLLMEFPKIVVVLPKDPDFLNLFSNVKSEAELLNIELYEMYSNVCNKVRIADDLEDMDNLAMQIHNSYLNLESAELLEKWIELTDEQKDWNRFPARHLAIKLRYLGAKMEEITSDEPEFDFSIITKEQQLTLAKVEHNRWVAEKLIARFRPSFLTGNKDVQKILKTKLQLHCNVRAWEELTEEDQLKDDMIINDLQKIVARARKKITKY